MAVPASTSDVTLRIFQESDIPALVEVINQAMAAYQLNDRISAEEIQHWLTVPFVNPEEDFFVAVNADNQIVGTGINMFNHRTGRGFGIISALPAYPDAKRQLLEAGDGQIQKRADAAITDADERPVYIIRQAITTQQDQITLLESAGYSDTRHFYEMQIVFDGEIEAPIFPEGIEIRIFEPEQHARAVHQAQQEAFRDHWGHAEDVPFDEWVKRLEHPHFNPSLYFIAWAGDQVAGISFCTINPAEPDAGWVDTLGVRRAWRKQGLGMALLRYSFQQFQQRGLIKAGLGVDATSKTNAVALYERGGMHIHNHAIAYRKVLRGNPADIVE